MTWRLRYKADAGGFVVRWRGQWASRPFDRREVVEDIQRLAPNGQHMEIVEVDE